MTEKRTPTASADGERIRVEVDGDSYTLTLDEAEALRDEVDDVLQHVGPNRIRNELSQIDGVGTAVVDNLANEFGTLDDVRDATDEELEAVHNVGGAVRMRIRQDWKSSKGTTEDHGYSRAIELAELATGIG